MRDLRLLWLLTLFSAPACGEVPDTLESPSSTVRDSAGIRVVENQWADVPVPGWSIGADPLFTVGDLAGDPRYEFTGVSGASVNCSGDM